MVAAVLHLHVRARAFVEAVDQVRSGFAHGHDVGDGDAFVLPRYESFRAHLLGVAEYARDLRHVGEALRIDLRGAASDDDLRVRSFATGAADRLARLAHRFASHGAGVDDDGVGKCGLARERAHGFALVSVEAAAERQYLDIRARRLGRRVHPVSVR